jgi:hypothetical protein
MKIHLNMMCTAGLVSTVLLSWNNQPPYAVLFLIVAVGSLITLTVTNRSAEAKIGKLRHVPIPQEQPVVRELLVIVREVANNLSQRNDRALPSLEFDYLDSNLTKAFASVIERTYPLDNDSVVLRKFLGERVSAPEQVAYWYAANAKTSREIAERLGVSDTEVETMVINLEDATRTAVRIASRALKLNSADQSLLLLQINALVLDSGRRCASLLQNGL